MSVVGPWPLHVRIAGTAEVPAGPAVTTAEIARRIDPPRDPADLERRTGIVSRRWAEPGPTASTELAVKALRLALDDAGMPAQRLERLIFVSSNGGDNVSPANATRIARGLDLDACDCFDLNNACVGFLSALDVAARSIATGSGPIGIAVVEMCSRAITPEDWRPYVIFADAAAAVVVEPGRGNDLLLASWLRTDAVAGGDVHIPHPLATRKMEVGYFTTSGARMGQDAVAYMRRAADAVLERAGLRMDEVEWVLPHQPNGPLFDRILENFGVDAARTVRVIDDCGSVSAVSIPISLDRLRRSGRVRPGDRILMATVATGLSYGAALLQVGG